MMSKQSIRIKHIILLLVLAVVYGCHSNKRSNESTHTVSTDSVVSSEVNDSTLTSKAEITADLAYEGVNNYCHSRYDWSAAEENPSIMYVQKGEETATEYQVVFRSYTGVFVYFYVEKSSGTTRMVEYVPSLDVTNEAGTIDIYDYLEKK